MAGLAPNARRLRTIIISFPVLVVTSAILYRRTYLGEEQRRIPAATTDEVVLGQERILGRGAGEVGGVPWAVQGKQEQAQAERALESSTDLRSR